MPITYPLSIPASLKIRAIDFQMEEAVAVTESPYTFQTQVQVHQGQRWLVGVQVALRNGDDAASIEAWLAALRGQYGLFTLGDSARTTPRGTNVGIPVVSGAGQSGMSLVTSGWGASQMVLKAGDWIQLGAVNEFTSEFTDEFFGDNIPRLHKVLTDTTSDSAGNATLDIWPRLRSSPSHNASITTTNCKGTFRLASRVSGWQTDVSKFRTFSFNAVEAF